MVGFLVVGWKCLSSLLNGMMMRKYMMVVMMMKVINRLRKLL